MAEQQIYLLTLMRVDRRFGYYGDRFNFNYQFSGIPALLGNNYCPNLLQVTVHLHKFLEYNILHYEN